MSSGIEQEPVRLLIVDDEEVIGRIIIRTLKSEGYVCKAVCTAKEALRELEKHEYSLVISDINMPELNGIQLLELIVEKEREIAVIMQTGVQDMNTAIHCLKLGAYDYLAKPIQETELSISVTRALERRQFLIRERQYQETLEREVQEKTQELRNTISQLQNTQGLLKRTQSEVIHRLAVAAEYRDEDTWEHLIRIADSTLILARKMGCDDEFCEMIHAASPLHDIGKIGIPDSVLLKPGRFTDDEYELMKTHTLLGEKILVKSESPTIMMACEIAIGHHEHFSGAGYPYGRKGDKTPLAARVVAVADVFDALITARPYKEAWSVERGVETISRDRGTHFDPDVVDAFVASVDKIVSAWDKTQEVSSEVVASNVTQ